MSRYAPGDMISGKYRIVRLIGDGGMGVVYEARHEVLGHGVALKFLHADLAKRPGLTQRFLQEARVSATIQSPHVTHVTDVDTDEDGSPYLVMELLSGQSLQAMLDWQGKLPTDQAVDFGLQILAGLEAAHAMGVVHRDMKPDNVFVTASAGGPVLKLIDFGIAKLRASSEFTKGLTRAGVVMGTPEYMAPEQLTSAHTADLRADIYSFGVMLFEMLGGCRPADGDDVEIIIAAVQGGRVRKLNEVVPGLPPGLVALVERATAAEREDRFASAAEMRLALAPFAGPLSHAGRLAAIAPPLAPVAPLETSMLSSFPRSSVRPPPSAVPKTVPPDAPPLSVSQLGAARTSISNDPAPTARGPMTGTAMGGEGTPYQVPQYGPPPQPHYAGAPLPAPARPKGRSGLLISLLVLVVLGGGGAVGYAAYRAADSSRIVAPPLPDAGTVATSTPSVEPIRGEGPAFPEATPTTVPTTPRVVTTGTKPSTGTASGGAAAGGSPSNPGQVVVIGAGGTTGGLQLPFPLPSSIQIPTAIPSQIQLPPGITFPPGFPGVGQPAPTATPTNAPTVTTPTAPPPTPTPTPTATSTRPRQSSKP
ncbi:MAG: serine/threonine protein kinase [Myxococcales bacterium]|nr:MAG: serine/threonine protein kinase [Myxococcales bacterium]